MENSRLFAPVAEPSRVGDFYVQVSGDRLDRQGAPARAAWEMERLAAMRGWPADDTLGSEASLCKRLGVSRETLREAIRIVESRGAMRMRRGRSGGLMLIRPTIQRTAGSLAAYLRAIGITNGQFAQSVRGFDLLLASQLSRKVSALPSRAPAEGLRHWLARASARNTYLIYISVLDKLAPGHAVVQAAPKGLREAIECREGGNVFRLLQALPFSPASDSGSSSEAGILARAGSIAMYIVERARESDATDLGSEADLCEEFGTSRSLIRQALRILQDLDMILVRLGRNGGYTLKEPSPIGIIRQFYVWLAARNCDPFALNELIGDLNSANLRLAGEKLATLPTFQRHAHCAEMDHLIATSPPGPARFIRLQQKLAEFADCPMVDALARCIVSYQARSYGDLFKDDSHLGFDRLEHAIVAALREGELDAAECALRDLQDQGEELAMETLGLLAAAE